MRVDGPTVPEKQPVVSLVHYETRSAHSRVVADVTAKACYPRSRKSWTLKRTHLHTDGASAYKTIAPLVAAHEWVDHKAGEYVRGNVSTNLNEGFHSQRMRTLIGNVDGRRLTYKPLIAEVDKPLVAKVDF